MRYFRYLVFLCAVAFWAMTSVGHGQHVPPYGHPYPYPYYGGAFYDPAAAYPAITDAMRKDTFYREQQANFRQTRQMQFEKQKAENRLFLDQAVRRGQENPTVTAQSTLEWMHQNQPTAPAPTYYTAAPAMTDAPSAIRLTTLVNTNGWPGVLGLSYFENERNEFDQLQKQLQQESQSGLSTETTRQKMQSLLGQMKGRLKEITSHLTYAEYRQANDHLLKLKKKTASLIQPPLQ